MLGNFRESSSDVLKVPELSAEVYELLLEFIYTNDVYFTQDTDIVVSDAYALCNTPVGTSASGKLVLASRTQAALC